ncbi:hypothetical protein CU044_5960 [Streptomyces sp. L-9-10]|nr:hypothetical protein CU044_5960 [Streptomyces sp. L-9-10]
MSVCGLSPGDAPGSHPGRRDLRRGSARVEMRAVMRHTSRFSVPDTTPALPPPLHRPAQTLAGRSGNQRPVVYGVSVVGSTPMTNGSPYGRFYLPVRRSGFRPRTSRAGSVARSSSVMGGPFQSGVMPCRSQRAPSSFSTGKSWSPVGHLTTGLSGGTHSRSGGSQRVAAWASARRAASPRVLGTRCARRCGKRVPCTASWSPGRTFEPCSADPEQLGDGLGGTQLSGLPHRHGPVRGDGRRFRTVRPGDSEPGTRAADHGLRDPPRLAGPRWYERVVPGARVADDRPVEGFGQDAGHDVRGAAPGRRVDQRQRHLHGVVGAAGTQHRRAAALPRLVGDSGVRAGRRQP